MGNILSGSSGSHASYRIERDNAATITVTKHQEKSEIKYDVDGMTSTLSICKSPRRNSGDEDISISVRDLYPNIQKHSANIVAKMEKKKEESGLVCDTNVSCGELPAKSGESRRGEVETQYWAYGSGTRMGLFVMEKKKKRSNEKLPYMVTVAHYYVNGASGRKCGGSADIGYSVVVKIEVSHNGQLGFIVDDPVDHTSSSALLYLIQEVIRTKTWKLSLCSHCKNNIQSETEDSDTHLPSSSRNEHPPRIVNSGHFFGNANGSSFRGNNFIR
ncbi:hypothetical protein VNO80_12343 [Phaseolus coccineus]|uniref:Uncharacterized protein n=1 Tax=Phaseolus coccineus TaxID=3886 RepID=A0AAN9N0F8_PHACN